MTAEEIGKIIRANGIQWNVCFFDPPYPKFWTDSLYGADFIIYYEPDTQWAVARGGQFGWRPYQVYYIGLVHEYSQYFNRISKTEYVAIQQFTARKGNGPWTWQKPEVLRHRAGYPAHLLEQVMMHTWAKVGHTGLPYVL